MGMVVFVARGLCILLYLFVLAVHAGGGFVCRHCFCLLYFLIFEFVFEFAFLYVFCIDFSQPSRIAKKKEKDNRSVPTN